MLAIDRHRLLRLCRTAAAAAFVVVMLCPPALWAADTGVDGFLARVSEKEMMLASTDDSGITDPAMVQHLEKDLSFQRLVARNMPYIELFNDADSNSPIAEYRMTIGDTAYHFSDALLGTYALAGTTTSGVDISSSVAMAGDELIVEILNGGLLPGDMLRFKIDIDPDFPTGTSADYADYRNVLFDTVSDPSQMSTADNSTVSVTFASGVSTDPVVFPDVEANSLVSNSITNANTSCCCFGRSQPLDIPFRLTGQIVVVPEPASATLCLVGLLSAVGACRRYRGARASS